MPLFRPQNDGTVKVWWRNAKAKQLLGEHIAVISLSDQPHHIAQATAELDQLVAEFKEQQGLVRQKAKVLADAAETEHLLTTWQTAFWRLKVWRILLVSWAGAPG